MLKTKHILAPGAALLCLLVASCGSTSEPADSGAASPAASDATTQWKGETINVLSWEGYQEPEWVEPFEQKYGVDVAVTYAGSVAEMFSKVVSGSTKYDMAFIDGGTIPRYVDQDLLLPVDTTDMASVQDFIPVMMDQAKPNLTIDGENYGVPFTWGAMPLAVNTEKVDPIPDSWAALFDQKYSGRIVIQDDANNVFPMTALYLGFADPFQLSDDQMNQIQQTLTAQRPLVLTYSPSQQTTQQTLASGNAWLGYVESTNIVGDLRAKGFPIQEVIPKEGSPVWVDNATILKSSAHPDLVKEYINYLVSADVQAQVAKKVHFGVANGAVVSLLTSDELAAVHMDDPNEFWKHLVYMAPPNDFAERVNIWNAVKAG